MLKNFCWCLLVSLLLVFSCEDDDLVFEGILLRDPTNQNFGTKGSRDLNDWENDGKLSKDVLKLLDFDSDVDLTGTDVSTVQIAAYPNPTAYSFVLNFSLSNSSLVKIIIVNQSMKVLYQSSFMETSNLVIDVSDPKKFPDGKIVRVYYSVSAAENPNYYVGHGDVWICRKADCF
jgi:hypothetical protein